MHVLVVDLPAPAELVDHHVPLIGREAVPNPVARGRPVPDDGHVGLVIVTDVA